MAKTELLESALALARRLDYEIRELWLNGTVGGPCELRGKKLIFLDVSLPPDERLEQVARALVRDEQLDKLEVPEPLAETLRRLRNTEAA